MLTASLQKGMTPPNKCFGYDTKPSEGEAPVMDLWECGMPLRCYYSKVHRPIVIVSVKSHQRIKQKYLIILFIRNHLNVCQQMTDIQY